MGVSGALVLWTTTACVAVSAVLGVWIVRSIAPQGANIPTAAAAKATAPATAL
ncbi:hypothetical protein [Streptomyces fulvoviolaceus]|uniref:hypothetical protein n=1 Tax=Streptomyces fulvoviolaceus TaxID=285535 RepID=UPI0021C0FE06|nr:hypothetical protein [Streptomyces fulvoviolaceus]MCT9075653.1 hypothetical protein [Streptomyces fulvoviolaceus]